MNGTTSSVKEENNERKKRPSISEQIKSFVKLMANDDGDVQRQITGVKGISQLSRGQYINQEVKENVLENEVFPILFKLLNENIEIILAYNENISSNTEEQNKTRFELACQLCSKACRVIFNFSVEEDMRNIVTKHGFIKPSIQVATYITFRTVNEKTILCKTNAIGAIANLATSPKNKINIVSQNGLVPLIEAIESAGTNVFQEIDVQRSLDSMCQHSCRALFALSANDENKILIEKKGALRPLINSLRARSWHVQWHAAGAIANLAIEKSNKLKIIHHGGLEPLIELAFSDSDRVQRQVARGLFALAAHPEIRPGICDLNGLQALNHLLGSHHEEVQRNAVGAIGNIAMTDSLKERIYQEGLIIPMLDLANSTNEFVQRQTARTLFCLSAHENVKHVIVREGGLLPLVHIAQSSLMRLSKKAGGNKPSKSINDIFEIQRDVAGAIANIAIGRGNKEKVADSGALIPLIQLTSSENSNVQRQAARALFALTGSERNQREIVKHNGLVPLLTLLSSSKVEVRKHAAGAVANIATNKDIKPDIIQCGALEPLLDATKSSDRHVQKQAVRGLRNLGVKDINVDINSCEYRRFASEMSLCVDVEDGFDDDEESRNNGNFCDLKIVYDNTNNKSDDDNEDSFEIKAHEIILRLRAPKMFQVLKYSRACGRDEESYDKSQYNTLATSCGSRRIWLYLLEFLYCGVIESFEHDLKHINEAYLPVFDSLEKLGLSFKIKTLMQYIKYLKNVMQERKRSYLPQPFALSIPCTFLNAFSPRAVDKCNSSNNTGSNISATRFDDSLCSDVKFRTEDGRIFCLHKVIVCARCPYFRALFTSGMRESRQNTVDVPWEGIVFERVVEYIYSGITDIRPDVACDLLMASNEWDMQGLQSLVEDELGRMIDEESVMMILGATSTVKAPRLKARCIYYLLNTFDVVEVTKLINEPSIDKELRYDVVDKMNSWGFASKASKEDEEGNDEGKMEEKFYSPKK